jgi:hypothetical protein
MSCVTWKTGQHSIRDHFEKNRGLVIPPGEWLDPVCARFGSRQFGNCRRAARVYAAEAEAGGEDITRVWQFRYVRLVAGPIQHIEQIADIGGRFAGGYGGHVEDGLNQL